MLFGFDRNVEYLRGALPAHALSDVADVGQYSLTVLVHAMGFPDALAERAGSVLIVPGWSSSRHRDRVCAQAAWL